jgi:ferritin-like metal-binding protein YciE
MAAQKVEHYEIASYGGLVQLATVLGESEAATLLEEILDEEKAADEKLTIIAEAGINEEAFMEDEA